MSTESATNGLKFNESFGGAIFFDVKGFQQQRDATQIAITKELAYIGRYLKDVLKDDSKCKEHTFLPLGDGGVIAFALNTDLEDKGEATYDHLWLALSLSHFILHWAGDQEFRTILRRHALAAAANPNDRSAIYSGPKFKPETQFEIRMGADFGDISFYTDCNSIRNVFGPVIVTAARLMDFSSPGVLAIDDKIMQTVRRYERKEQKDNELQVPTEKLINWPNDDIWNYLCKYAKRDLSFYPAQDRFDKHSKRYSVVPVSCPRGKDPVWRQPSDGPLPVGEAVSLVPGLKGVVEALERAIAGKFVDHGVALSAIGQFNDYVNIAESISTYSGVDEIVWTLTSTDLFVMSEHNPRGRQNRVFRNINVDIKTRVLIFDELKHIEEYKNRSGEGYFREFEDGSKDGGSLFFGLKSKLLDGWAEPTRQKNTARGDVRRFLKMADLDIGFVTGKGLKFPGGLCFHSPLSRARVDHRMPQRISIFGVSIRNLPLGDKKQRDQSKWVPELINYADFMNYLAEEADSMHKGNLRTGRLYDDLGEMWSVLKEQHSPG